MDEKRITSTLTIQNFWKQIQYNKANHLSTNLSISPKFEALLKKANTTFQNLEPLTFNQFLQRNDLTINTNINDDSSEYYDRYQDQMQRRKRQIQILEQMNNAYFQKVKSSKKQNHSSHKASRGDNSTSRKTKISNFNYRTQRSEKKDNFVKFTTLSQYELHHKNNKKSKLIQRKTSVFSSSSHQRKNKNMDSKKAIKQIQIFEKYTEGRPYIEQYYNQMSNKFMKSDGFRPKTASSRSSNKRSERQGKIGKISRQNINLNSTENQYKYFSRNQKDKNSKARKITKQNNHSDYEQNQYDMLPPKNDKGVLSKASKNAEKQLCKQLIVQVKKYEQNNKNYIKKIKQTDKKDRLSRQKLMEINSRQKIDNKRNIQKLKQRITSKHSKR